MVRECLHGWAPREKKIKYWHIVWTINKQQKRENICILYAAAVAEITPMFHNHPIFILHLMLQHNCKYVQRFPRFVCCRKIKNKYVAICSDYPSASTYSPNLFSLHTPTVLTVCVKVINLNLHFLGAPWRVSDLSAYFSFPSLIHLTFILLLAVGNYVQRKKLAFEREGDGWRRKSDVEIKLRRRWVLVTDWNFHFCDDMWFMLWSM